MAHVLLGSALGAWVLGPEGWTSSYLALIVLAENGVLKAP